MTDPKETAERAEAHVALLLDEIENEPVPERLLDLALRLQKALHERHARIENADQGVRAGDDFPIPSIFL